MISISTHGWKQLEILDYVSNEYYQNANTFSFNFYRHSTPNDNKSMQTEAGDLYIKIFTIQIDHIVIHGKF